ncbi:MAG: MBL fold metallo-hydrolase [Gammaproteobacteria bacterium]
MSMKLTRTVFAAASFALCHAAFAAAPMVMTQAPGFYRTMLGDFEVTALNDGTIDLPPEKLLHAKADKIKKALDAAFVGSPVQTSVNAYLINTGSKLVLIDAGAGALFGPTVGQLAANLKAAGYQPEQVDEIYITHLHGDHLGGVSPAGSIAFPNATVRVDKHDADYWLDKSKMETAPAELKGLFQGAITTLEPYIKANRLQTFEGDTELVPGVKALGTHGHTPGHTTYVVESKGQKLLVIGDLIHVGAVQLADPTVTINFDSDSKAAMAQRLKTFSAAAKDGSLVGAAHIQFPGLGHLKQTGKSYQWVPVNYTQIR